MMNCFCSKFSLRKGAAEFKTKLFKRRRVSLISDITVHNISVHNLNLKSVTVSKRGTSIYITTHWWVCLWIQNTGEKLESCHLSDVLLFFAAVTCFHEGDDKSKVNCFLFLTRKALPHNKTFLVLFCFGFVLFFAFIMAVVLTVFEVTPVCTTGGQLDQRGAECRWSAGSSFQRSHYSSGRGGSGRRG